MTFLVVYITRIGTNGFQISLLTAGPALMQLLFSLPVGRYLERLPLIPSSYIPAFIQRSGHLLLVFLPSILPEQTQIWAIILITLLGSIPGTFLMIGFNAMFADLIPVEERGRVVSRRNALSAIALTGSALLSGYLLDKVSYPLNYQLVFLIGSIGALGSSFILTRLRNTSLKSARVGQPMGELLRPGSPAFAPFEFLSAGLRFLTRRGGKPLLRLDLLKTPYGYLMGAYLVFYTCQYVGIPIFPVYLVRDLQLKDSQISIGSVLFYLMMFLCSLQLTWMAKRWGHRRILVSGALVFCLYPFLLMLANGVTLYWIAMIIGGVIWAMINAGLINRLMERVPENDRPAGMALHNLTMNSGILGGSLTGPLIANAVGLHPALLISGLLRLGAGFILMRWG